MGRDIRLPKREKNDRLELTDLQMVFLDCYLLQIADPKTLFHRLIASSKTVKESNSMMQSLIRNSDAVKYMEDRTEQILSYFGRGGEKSHEEERSLEEVQKMIVKKATKDLLYEMEHNTAEIKNGNVIEKILVKALEVDDSTLKAQEPPRVYLPENCGNCRYRVACEDPDMVIDECKFCKYRQDDLDRGVEYDYKTQLNIKQE